MVMLITYGTVAVQVAFPFTLFNRRVKNVLLAAMMIEHAVIAVTLGLPFFSLAMIAADAVFLPTSFLQPAGRLGGTRAWQAVRPRALGGLAKAPDGGGRGDGSGRTATVPGPRAREAGGSVAGTGAVDGKDADPTHVGFRA